MSAHAISPELQQKIRDSRAELRAVQARINALRRTQQLAVATRTQVSKDNTKEHVWQGVGKMFKQISFEDFSQQVENRVTTTDEQIKALEKKEQYYSVTLDKLILAAGETD